MIMTNERVKGEDPLEKDLVRAGRRRGNLESAGETLRQKDFNPLYPLERAFLRATEGESPKYHNTG